MSPVPRTLQGAPDLSQAEREALDVLTQHARERARLDCVWLFTHPIQTESESTLELVVRACAAEPSATDDDAARAAVVRSIRGDRRRFSRGGGTEAAGTHVATAARAASAVSAAGLPAEDATAADVDRALADLAAVALQLANPEPPPAEAPPARTEGPAAPPEPSSAWTYGATLAPALSRLEQPPVLPESRARLAAAVARPHGALADAAQVVETDIGLALAVVARANRTAGRPRGGILSVPNAIDAIGVRTVAALAAALPPLRPESAAGDRIAAALLRITPHAIVTRAAADMIATGTGTGDRESLRLAALLHDVGKVVLAASGAGYLERALDPCASPAERIALERRAFGVDHAGLGAIALTRLGVPKRIAEAVERHHTPDADGAAAVLRLADMIAHDARGAVVDSSALATAAEAVGISPADAHTLAYDLARTGGPRGVGAEPSPLTPMQQKVLLGLRRGQTYKQIAIALQVSESTVRSHLHKTYERLGVVDRAQAVLMAQERGWI